jgi:mitotic spindle assembly checkpoint protein MAD1
VEHDAQLERLELALAEAKTSNAKLTKHLEVAEKQLAEYERRLGRGEYNAESIKIVHLAVNPTSELLQTRQDAVHEQLEELRKENEALRAQFEQLSGTSLSPVSADSSWTMLPKRIN